MVSSTDRIREGLQCIGLRSRPLCIHYVLVLRTVKLLLGPRSKSRPPLLSSSSAPPPPSLLQPRADFLLGHCPGCQLPTCLGTERVLSVRSGQVAKQSQRSFGEEVNNAKARRVFFACRLVEDDFKHF